MIHPPASPPPPLVPLPLLLVLVPTSTLAVAAALSLVLRGFVFSRPRGARKSRRNPKRPAWDTQLPLLPPGLVNLGNSCYANVLLQALASTPRFIAFLHARNVSYLTAPVIVRPSRAFARAAPLLPITDALLASIVPLTRLASNPHCETPSNDFVAAFLGGASNFNFSQQDSHELLQLILRGLEHEDDRLLLRDSIHPLFSTAALRSHTSRLNPPKPVQIPTNPLQGLYATHITCQICGYVTPFRHYPFTCLTLALPYNSTSVMDLLKDYVRPELIDDKKCEMCGLADFKRYVLDQLKNGQADTKKQKAQNRDLLKRIEYAIQHDIETTLVRLISPPDFGLLLFTNPKLSHSATSSMSTTPTYKTHYPPPIPANPVSSHFSINLPCQWRHHEIRRQSEPKREIDS